MKTRAAGKVPVTVVERRKGEYDGGRKSIQERYFGLESLLLLICLTASLLILPLILPPLPPPPFMLLLLPIAILTVLMLLAFMPSNVRDITL
ncbi:Late embryoproteinsis abundant protein, group 2 isoform 1 [Hibiscus syriacus]|uniref:Late embryoproteinsis abundant protein, group 2 isoform 1 n=1 Tax=Hibiscus syriacus TaxID=106335 RepID=A0A6A3BDU2_HIBSY|nr:Late embryoproteinsis abundant protein, group 2 isoform 1 [Hibiscus syriacus]